MALIVGVLELTLYLPGNHSLKGKRAVLRSIKARVQAKFNVSVAEISGLNTVQVTIRYVIVATRRTDSLTIDFPVAS